ncbi:MAG: ribosome biogenesis GTPase Der, partial [Halieaceae bacterium]|nr:ribosome biogenesis GTPase Der [Halieaceae bacterium]
MLPVIALVGRPNVGKSTLFNRLTRSRDALVANFPGLTRDRNYGVGQFGSKSFVVIDTGGIGVAREGLDALAEQQSLQAIEEADTVCLLVDARTGLTSADTLLAAALRRQGKVFHLVVNKIDGIGADLAAAEFHALGVDDLHPVSATHGHGVSSLLERLLQGFPEAGNEPPAARNTTIRVAIVGRPNVGKSTLVNRMLGEDRVLVYDQPGTTRDSIYIDFERRELRYTLIDTAGVRRHKKVRKTVEKFSIVKTLKAIDDAHVVILMMDAGEGVVEQDLHLLGLALTAGRGVVIAVNKWDALDTQARRRIHSELQRRLMFVDYADVRFISALRGTGVERLYPSLHGAFDSASRKLSTNKLNR